MSGRKRALIRMNERDRKKLQKIESRLGSVDIDFSLLNSRIDEINKLSSIQYETKLAKRDENLSKSIAHLDSRMQQIEATTQKALHDHVLSMKDLQRESINNSITLRNFLGNQFTAALDDVIHFFGEYDEQISLLNNEIEDIRSREHHQQEIAWQNLSYTQEIFSNLKHIYQNQDEFKHEFNQIESIISTGWINFQNESYQAALQTAQQAVRKVIDLRFKIEEMNLQFENLKLTALKKSSQVLDLALNCQEVRAIDLDGTELEIMIDVDSWNGGLIQKALETLYFIQSQLSEPEFLTDYILLNELVYQTLPGWEKALHDYVTQARIEVIASQSRFEVAKTVISALAEQGFELEDGSYETGDMRTPYHLILSNLEGSQVHISVASAEGNPLDYLLDIDSYDSELRTETELRQRTRELLGSVQASGLKVGQLYQGNQNESNQLKEPQNRYSVRTGENSRARNQKSLPGE